MRLCRQGCGMLVVSHSPLALQTATSSYRVGHRYLAVADIYINTDDGWDDHNRTTEGKLHPASSFTNSTTGLRSLTDALHAKGFKFGIYAAAGETTCGDRAGTLYHERNDAAQFKAWGVDCAWFDGHFLSCTFDFLLVLIEAVC